MANTSNIGGGKVTPPLGRLFMRKSVEQMHAEHAGGELKKSLGAIKRSIYFGNTLSLEDGLQLEYAEFLVRDQSKDAQGRMLEYIATTEITGELPLLDRQKYAHAMRVGRFGGQPGR